jgi:endonuclease/exonuclease/phosphatase family metal-dependent hydrolase
VKDFAPIQFEKMSSNDDLSCWCINKKISGASANLPKSVSHGNLSSAIEVFDEDEKAKWPKFDNEMKDGFQFTLLTWNVWFDSFMFERRCKEIFTIIRKFNPDFVCFQEVTRNFINLMCKEEFVRETYFVSDVDGRTVSPYGTLILSKYELDCFHQFSFERSEQGRSLLAAPFMFHRDTSETLVVSTSHLESIGRNAPVRIEQLGISFKILETVPNGILCGDFNFCQDWKENSHIPDSYEDLWHNLRPEEFGYTMPPNGRFKAWRPDRVLLKSESKLISSVEICKIGTEPIEYPDMTEGEKEVFVLTPSDHHGLFAKFIINSQPGS